MGWRHTQGVQWRAKGQTDGEGAGDSQGVQWRATGQIDGEGAGDSRGVQWRAKGQIDGEGAGDTAMECSGEPRDRQMKGLETQPGGAVESHGADRWRRGWRHSWGVQWRAMGQIDGEGVGDTARGCSGEPRGR